MPQVKIYGRRDRWASRREEVSAGIHQCMMSVWRLPEEKVFHRFILLDPDDFIAPTRTENYLIIEVMCLSGRSVRAKKALVRALCALSDKLDIDTDDVEVTLVEMPAPNWGIRGVPADELTLPYPVNL